ncbi:hypothetical protein RZS08_61790, partial [Arthrospira platensis SPKY1]|nr:hypothetical protein [Arthrospira platensis SPKY1]
MAIGTGGHLRQVCHRQHLAIGAKLPEQLADGVGHRTAHARIDFVEDEGGGLPQPAGDHRDGQGNAGQ